MITFRQKKFSKDKSDKTEDRIAAHGSALGSLAVASAGTQALAAKSAKGILNTKITAADKDIVKKKILKEAEKQGTKVVRDNSLPSAAYVGTPAAKIVKKGAAKVVKVAKKMIGADATREAIEGIHMGNSAFKHFGKDRVILTDKLDDVDVLSHEIGHSKYFKKGRSKNVVAKTAHKLHPLSTMATGSIATGASAFHGFKSGQKSVKNKREGKKDSTWNKVRSVAIPAAAVAPLLVAEGAASVKGLRMMKKAGASKELMKQSKKRLGSAFGTYVAQGARPVIAGQLGREAGKVYEKSKDKKNKKK